jgi:hypothetical protein
MGALYGAWSGSSIHTFKAVIQATFFVCVRFVPAWLLIHLGCLMAKRIYF